MNVWSLTTLESVGSDNRIVVVPATGFFDPKVLTITFSCVFSGDTDADDLFSLLRFSFLTTSGNQN